MVVSAGRRYDESHQKQQQLLFYHGDVAIVLFRGMEGVVWVVGALEGLFSAVLVSALF